MRSVMPAASGHFDAVIAPESDGETVGRSRKRQRNEVPADRLIATADRHARPGNAVRIQAAK